MKQQNKRKCKKCNATEKVYKNGYCPDCYHLTRCHKRKGKNVKAYREEQQKFLEFCKAYNKAHPIEDVELLFRGLKAIGVFS